MQDGIIKGTGNSRYLKSISNFLTQYPTYQDFVAALVAGTLPIDLNGINETGWDQLGTALNKANLLSDETAAALGLPNTAVPDDALLSMAQTLTGDLFFKKKLLNSISGSDQAVAIDLTGLSSKRRHLVVFTADDDFVPPYMENLRISFSFSGGLNHSGASSVVSSGSSQFEANTGQNTGYLNLAYGPDTVLHLFGGIYSSNAQFGFVTTYGPASLALIKGSAQINASHPLTAANLTIAKLPVGMSVALYEEVY